MSIEFVLVNVVLALVLGVAGNLLTMALVKRFEGKQTIGTAAFWRTWLLRCLLLLLPLACVIALSGMRKLSTECHFAQQLAQIATICQYVRNKVPADIAPLALIAAFLAFLAAAKFALFVALGRWISPLSKSYEEFFAMRGLGWGWAAGGLWFTGLLFYSELTGARIIRISSAAFAHVLSAA